MGTILVIDDDQLMARAVKRVLESRYPDMEVVSCETIREGREKIYSLKPSLIICDFQIGSDLGSDLRRLLDRDGGKESEIPWIYYSGDTVAEAKKKAGGDLGNFKFWIEKPIRFDELFKVMDGLLGR